MTALSATEKKLLEKKTQFLKIFDYIVIAGRVM